jgi:hypothetical protein
MARISEETGIHVATLYLWRKGWRLEGEIPAAWLPVMALAV